MNNDIKEILDYLKKEVDKFEESKTYLMETYNYREQDIENIEQHKKYVYFKKLLDYITNLQEELEDLRENDWAWHQTLKAQNKREYRSKFLKEFQQEYNTNTFPDYDEIYKRYDKLKKENERLEERCEYLQRSCNRKEEERDYARMEYMEQEDYKSRNEKANEFIKEHTNNFAEYLDVYEAKELSNILQGSDKA